MKSATKGTVYAMVSGILLGLSPLFAKTVYGDGGNAVTLVLARMLFGMVFFYLAFRMSHHKRILLKPVILGKLLLCATAYVLTPILLYTSYYYMDTGLATSLQFIYPALVLLGGAVFCHTPVTKNQLYCCIICIFGVFCLYGGGGEIGTKGLVIVLLAAVSYSFYTVYLNVSGLLQLPLFQISFWLCLFGAVISALISLLTGQLHVPAGNKGWIVLIVYTFAMAAAQIAYQKGNYYIGGAKASVLSAIEPLTSVLVGILVYQETMTFRAAIGLICILCSVCLLNKRQEKTDRKER